MLMSKPELELAKVAAPDNARFSLSALGVHAKHTEATDGFKFIRWTPDERLPDADFPVCEAVKGLKEVNGNGPFLLPRDTALAAAKAIPKRNRMPILGRARFGTDKDGQAVIASTDLAAWSVQRTKPEEGTWPKTEKIIPPPEKTKATVVLSAKHMKAIAERAAAFGIVALRLEVTGEDTQVVFTGRTREEDPGTFLAVLMPMRGDLIPPRQK